MIAVVRWGISRTENCKIQPKIVTGKDNPGEIWVHVGLHRAYVNAVFGTCGACEGSAGRPPGEAAAAAVSE